MTAEGMIFDARDLLYSPGNSRTRGQRPSTPTRSALVKTLISWAALQFFVRLRQLPKVGTTAATRIRFHHPRL